MYIPKVVSKKKEQLVNMILFGHVALSSQCQRFHLKLSGLTCVVVYLSRSPNYHISKHETWHKQW